MFFKKRRAEREAEFEEYCAARSRLVEDGWHNWRVIPPRAGTILTARVEWGEAVIVINDPRKMHPCTNVVDLVWRRNAGRAYGKRGPAVSASSSSAGTAVRGCGPEARAMSRCSSQASFTAQRASFRSANGMLSPRRTSGRSHFINCPKRRIASCSEQSKRTGLFTAGRPISFARLGGMLAAPWPVGVAALPDQFVQIRQPIPYGTSEPNEGRRFPHSSPGMQRRDRHPEHLGNLPLAKQTIILQKCTLRFSMVGAREHAAGRSNFRSNQM